MPLKKMPATESTRGPKRPVAAPAAAPDVKRGRGNTATPDPPSPRVARVPARVAVAAPSAELLELLPEAVELARELADQNPRHAKATQLADLLARMSAIAAVGTVGPSNSSTCSAGDDLSDLNVSEEFRTFMRGHKARMAQIEKEEKTRNDQIKALEKEITGMKEKINTENADLLREIYQVPLRQVINLYCRNENDWDEATVDDKNMKIEGSLITFHAKNEKEGGRICGNLRASISSHRSFRALGEEANRVTVLAQCYSSHDALLLVRGSTFFEGEKIHVSYPKFVPPKFDLTSTHLQISGIPPKISSCEKALRLLLGGDPETKIGIERFSVIATFRDRKKAKIIGTLLQRMQVFGSVITVRDCTADE